MTSTLSGASDLAVARSPKEIAFVAATEAAALFDPDVRDVLAALERCRKTADRRSAA